MVKYKSVICPVCKSVTLDNFYPCKKCGWKYDGILNEMLYSSVNRATILDHKLYLKNLQEAVSKGYYRGQINHDAE